MKSARSNVHRFFALMLFVFLMSCQTGRPIKKLSDESIMYGMIYDNESNPVSGVAVFLNGRKIVDSDIQGRFVLNGVKRGTYTIKLSRRGYEEIEEKFDYEPLNVLYFRMFNSYQLLSLAENSMDDNNFTAAEQFINRALQVEPGRQDILFLKSINFYLQKKYIDAQAILEGLIRSGSTDESIAQLYERVKELSAFE